MKKLFVVMLLIAGSSVFADDYYGNYDSTGNPQGSYNPAGPSQCPGSAPYRQDGWYADNPNYPGPDGSRTLNPYSQDGWSNQYRDGSSPYSRGGNPYGGSNPYGVSSNPYGRPYPYSQDEYRYSDSDNPQAPPRGTNGSKTTTPQNGWSTQRSPNGQPSNGTKPGTSTWSPDRGATGTGTAPDSYTQQKYRNQQQKMWNQ